MHYKLVFTVLFVLVFAFFAGCSKTSDKQTTDNSKNTQTSQTVGQEKSVEIQCSGMMCTDCENTIKSRVNKLDGIKSVQADYKTNKVIATYDDGKTNVDAIKVAIKSAGYSVESVKQ